MYAQDYDERLPMGGNAAPTKPNRWYDWIAPYTKNRGINICPSAPGQTPQDYGVGGYGCDINVMGWGAYPVQPTPPGRALAEITDSAGTFVIFRLLPVHQGRHREGPTHLEQLRQQNLAFL